MNEKSDFDLIRSYTRDGSEDAFATVVDRYINLVHSVALRRVGVAAQAEEITQAVFIILARKAAGLPSDVVLAAWLHRTASLTALSFLRGERRRQFREQEAYMQSTLGDSADAAAWNQLSPALDEAMLSLGQQDREAVVLRYFSDKSVREISATMNVSEAAAQRRVTRAVEKLRRFFTKRGIALTAPALVAAMSANSVQAAPVGLAKTVSAIAAAKGATASTSTLGLIKGTSKLMLWLQAKTAIIAGASALFVVSTATIAVTAASSKPEIQGTWQCTIALPGAGVHPGEAPKTRLVVRFEKTNGVYIATGENIDAGLRGTTTNIIFTNRMLHFEGDGSVIDGIVNRFGTKISGTLSASNFTTRLEFTRTSHPPPFPEALTEEEFAPRAGSTLQGFWDGKIVGRIHANIKISESSTGLFRADFYCPDNSTNRQPSSVSYNGKIVRIEPMEGYGMFEGIIRDNGNELAGNWVQNDKKAPTLFRKTAFKK